MDVCGCEDDVQQVHNGIRNPVHKSIMKRNDPFLSLFLFWSVSTSSEVEAAYQHPSSSQLYQRRNHDMDRRSWLSVGSAMVTSRVISPSSTAVVAKADTSQSVQLLGGPRVPLDGARNGFPLASFGLQVYDDETAYRLTLTALEVGYRNFFASVLAGNQKGFARAIKASGVPREEIYICGTVLSNRAQGEEEAFRKTKQGCQTNMNAMAVGGIDKLDQIMLDYPGPDAESVRGQWKAFEDMKKEGLVDSLAVSNFSARQLDAILSMGKDVSKPVVNQLPFSIAYHPPNILEYNTQRGILVQSWSPLSRVLTNPTLRPKLASIGNNCGKSPAQVALRYIIQSGAAFCTQSKSKKHFEEDLNVFDFELSSGEMTELVNLA